MWRVLELRLPPASQHTGRDEYAPSASRGFSGVGYIAVCRPAVLI